MLDAARRTAARELFPGGLGWVSLVFVPVTLLDLVLTSIAAASWAPLAAVVALTLLLLWWSKRRFDRALPAALAQAEKDYLALCEVTGQTPR